MRLKPPASAIPPIAASLRPQFDPNDVAFGVEIEHDARQDFLAFQHLGPGQPDISGVGGRVATDIQGRSVRTHRGA